MSGPEIVSTRSPRLINSQGALARRRLSELRYIPRKLAAIVISSLSWDISLTLPQM